MKTIDKESLRNKVDEMYLQLLNQEPKTYELSDGTIHYYSGPMEMEYVGIGKTQVGMQRMCYGQETSASGKPLDYVVVSIIYPRYRQSAQVEVESFQVSDGFKPVFDFVWSIVGE